MREIWENILEKPKWMRVSMWVGSLLFITFIYWQYFYSARQEEYDKLAERLDTVQKQIQTETARVNKLPQLRKELEKLNELYLIASEKLPKEDEADKLLGSISYVARNSGIDAPRFTPDSGETIRDFYAEKLVNVEMRGSYHKVAEFLDELTHIPRIVNVADIVMEHPKSFRDTEGVEVDVKGVLKIFRYLRPEERPQGSAKGDEDAKNEKAKRK